MPVVRYDVKNATGIFEERYWRASSKPVLNNEGEVAYIINCYRRCYTIQLKQKKHKAV